MKAMTVWLGALILAVSVGGTAFAAQQPDCCVDRETERSQMRIRDDRQMRSTVQEAFPWETPGGKMRYRTKYSLAE